MSAKKWIGLFGGTFDPIHYGHLALLESVDAALDFERIYVIPCYLPVHKANPAAAAAHRLAMLRLALESYPSCALSEVEIQRAEPSYTIDTVKYFKQVYPDQPLAFIMGSDSFQNFQHWHNFEEIFSLATLVIATRPGTDLTHHPLLLSHPDRIVFVETPNLEIASTAIRQDPKRFLTDIPKNVVDYILQHGLYQPSKTPC